MRKPSNYGLSYYRIVAKVKASLTRVLKEINSNPRLTFKQKMVVKELFIRKVKEGLPTLLSTFANNLVEELTLQ